MAVCKMKHLSAIAPREASGELAKKLVWLSCVDVDVSPEGMPDDSGGEIRLADISAERERIKAKTDDAVTAINLLSGRNTVAKRGLLSPKPEMERGDADPARLESAGTLTKRAVKIARRLESLSAERAGIKSDMTVYEPWLDYDLPLDFSKTSRCDIFMGSLPAGTQLDNFESTVSDNYAASVIFSKESDGAAYVAIVVHKSEASELMRLLSSLGFVKSPAFGINGRAAEIYSRMKETVGALDREEERILAEADEIAPMIGEVEFYYDRCQTELSVISAKERMANTAHTVILSGWVPEASVDEVVGELTGAGCAYELRDPSSDDDVPVLLKNNKFAESFEPVVALYSLPKYGTFDPTFVMSFFYILIFGLMFADVGYGALLSICCVLGLRLMKPRGSLKKFLQMFAICGVSCVVMGVLLGGYFGDLPSKIAYYWFGVDPEPELSIWFNPVSDPMTFLIVSIAVGAIHLVAGLCVKFYILLKTKGILDAIFDAGGWILVFLGAAVAIIGYLVGGILFNIGIGMVVLAYLLMICTGGRNEKNPVMRVLKGFMSLYDTISYVSDLLSYSRILSLGLASAVIASVFNILGTMGGLSFGGICIFVVAILIGHLLNMAINLLGTFVHTSRLQYIEFFGKFYEGGGRVFAPVSPDSKYYVYKEK
ncbi:MAG: V-type ATP synthase subunit I [Clostridia bacterium]|nr:V-type ATP synthase subunit I [Clostridia bacterium]